MRRVLHAVCLVVLTLAFIQSEAAGQPGRRRVGIPRPGPEQPTQPSTPTTTPGSPESPSQSTGQAAASASQYKAAIEYQSFNGKPFKSYKAEVRGGQLQRHPRNAMNTEPHTDFISPRLVDTSSRTTSSYAMRDTYWVRKN